MLRILQLLPQGTGLGQGLLQLPGVAASSIQLVLQLLECLLCSCLRLDLGASGFLLLNLHCSAGCDKLCWLAQDLSAMSPQSQRFHPSLSLSKTKWIEAELKVQCKGCTLSRNCMSSAVDHLQLLLQVCHLLRCVLGVQPRLAQTQTSPSLAGCAGSQPPPSGLLAAPSAAPAPPQLQRRQRKH